MGSAASAKHPCRLEDKCPVCLEHMAEYFMHVIPPGDRFVLAVYPYGPPATFLPCGHKLHSSCIPPNEEEKIYRCAVCRRRMPVECFGTYHIAVEFSCQLSPRRLITLYRIIAVHLPSFRLILRSFGFGPVPMGERDKFLLHPAKISRRQLTRCKWRDSVKSCWLYVLSCKTPFFVIAP